MKRMRRYVKRFMAFVLMICMIVPMLFSLNVHAESEIADTFYVLDDEGNPVRVDVTKEDLLEAKEEGTYADRMEGEAVSLFSAEPAADEEQRLDGVVRFARSATTFTYKETDTGRNGYLSPYTTADAAYLGTEGDYIICKVAGVTMKVEASKVASIGSYKDGSVGYYYAYNGYLVHRVPYYNGSTLLSSSVRVGLVPSYLDTAKSYYSYDGHYFYESYETMIGDYRAGNYANAVNADKPFYNYYQYLSLHTTAPAFSGDDIDAYIADNKANSVMNGQGGAFVRVQNKYTINSMLMLGIAINESGWGTSNLAKNKNNLFGLNAVDSNPYESGNSFSSVEACIDDFAYGWMHTGYMNGMDSRYRGPHLGDKQSGVNIMYASDPYWGEKGASRAYYFDEGQKDYGRYDIGISNKGILSLYKEPSSSSKVLYTSEVGSGGKLYNYPVTILDKITGTDGKAYYKVISDMSLKSDRSARNVDAAFDITRDYVYAKAEDIDVIFERTAEIKKVKLLNQLQSVSAMVGNTVDVVIEAEGDGLVYKWYFANKGSNVFSLTNSFKGNRYSVQMSESRAGRRIYCVVSDAYGNMVRTDTITLLIRKEATIIKQPQSVSVQEGEKAVVTVEAEGDGLTYKWYFANAGKEAFSYTSSFKSNSYYVTMTEARAGRRIYCVITDEYGNSVKTDVVTLEMKPAIVILSQPKSVTVKEGEIAKAEVKAEGNGLTYKWYFANAGKEAFSYTSSFKSNSYYVTMTEARDGRRIYCEITDQKGNCIKTDVVTLRMEAPVVITQQPVSVRVKKGEMARVEVMAEGENLTYRWYFADAGKTKFSYTSTFKGNAYYVKMTDARAGRRVYCIISDDKGYSVKTNTVTLKMN